VKRRDTGKHDTTTQRIVFFIVERTGTILRDGKYADESVDVERGKETRTRHRIRSRRGEDAFVADNRESRCGTDRPRALVNIVYLRNTVIIPKRAKRRKGQEKARLSSAGRAMRAREIFQELTYLTTVNMGTLHTMHILCSFYVADGSFSIARANSGSGCLTMVVRKGLARRAKLAASVPPPPPSVLSSIPSCSLLPLSYRPPFPLANLHCTRI